MPSARVKSPTLLADFTVGRFRVHLVQEGERYGAGGGFVYGKALSNGSFGIPINDCQLYGHGLPLVEFYDVSQDPAKFPEGQVRHPLLHVHSARHGLHRR